MDSYGLIFKDNEDGLWLGLYEEGTISDFDTLSDFDGVYEDLALSKFAFVKVKDSDNERVVITDVSTFEMAYNEKDGDEPKPVPVTEMLESLKFPSDDCNNIFRSFLAEAGKTN